MNIRLLLTFVFFIVSVTCHAADYQHAQKDAAVQALDEMLIRERNPFVIIEVSGTDKYIQFYNKNPGLLLDLPEVALSEKEVKLASAYFSKHGINSVKTTARDPATGDTFVLVGWTKIFDPLDVDEVVDIAFGALFEIYGITKETQLTFEKGWE